MVMGNLIINTPSPMQTPATPHCEQFYMANPGDTCFSIATSHGLDVPSFCSLNPVMGTGELCSTNLLAYYWYCVKELARKDWWTSSEARLEVIPITGRAVQFGNRPTKTTLLTVATN